MTETQNRRIAFCMLFWPVLKTYILRWMVGLCIDGHIYIHVAPVYDVLPVGLSTLLGITEKKESKKI